ncbi:hypothetical protein NADFUDRAFT_33521 [Nadsonia fulvescens var. elongata DSM 6958]|uniref:Uncharacterized protein n=1 Tax=Nadsonia fulvescens var. elongata DSM 6958 TaxID=857566 RepID=A0A1E3PMW1_9ASCO|nr:hypothetical protein NADFUDRAFT_33521 [Nadsonia fulvescens var. elongata DSM 6958]
MFQVRSQMIAFKSLTKNAPIPPPIQANLLLPTLPGSYAPHQAPSNPHALQRGQPHDRLPQTQSQQPLPPAPAQIPIEVLDSYLDPNTFIPESVKFTDYIARQQQLFIPSIMPGGIDVYGMYEERDDILYKKLNSRAQILADAVGDISERLKLETKAVNGIEDSLDKLIELNGLKLIQHQRAFRGDLLANTSHFNSLALNESNKFYFSWKKQSSLEESITIERFEAQQRNERKKRESIQKMELLSATCTHATALFNAGKSKRSKFVRLGKSVLTYHATTEREEQKRIERTAKQRLQALKANDEEAYIKLLDQTKDTRITHLLRQTNSFLDSLAQAVMDQQREAKARIEEMEFDTEIPVGVPADESLDDEDAGQKVDYYAVAHKVKEVITKQPSILIGGTLKEYQIKGLQWMVSLFNNNLNGILADEMGLGKTIQTISLITYLIETKKITGPYLVIVPLSTLTNWNLEFEKWAPSVKKVVYKGPPMARKAQQATIRSGDFQVCLTTFEYIIKDKSILGKVKWIHMIIDEGHRMKNAQSKLSHTLTQFYSSNYRLILTGTPLQNNLPELWALLNFVLPKIFNSVKSFDEWFNTPFANTGSQDKMALSEEETLLVIRRLHKVLRPFLLRRLKKDVEKDLPDKVEKVIKCKMSALQQKLYEQVLKHNHLYLGDSGKGNKGGLKGLNNRVMQLRKICNHPFVFEEIEDIMNPNHQTNDSLWRTAGKFELLDRVLPKFQVTGHRVLMFFQMTQIMDIMEDFLRSRNLKYLRLDGATKADERSELLGLFNAPDSPYFAFLLSTRAGGLGLNLQTADTVIIYDTDWNPHQDLQAQDRAHRIGQTKEVRIFRLITEDSVEEMILERAHQKLDIDGKVIQAGKFDNKSTSEEQEAFLRSLLEAEEAKKEATVEDEELDEDELNDLLARSDEERLIFKKIDNERNAQSDYGKSLGRPLDRLMGENELPAFYHEEREIDTGDKEDLDAYGKGARERKVAHYDDGLTEEQWLDALDDDNDTIDAAVQRKRARIAKRKFNKDHRDSGPDDSDYGSDNSDASQYPKSVKRINNNKGATPNDEFDISGIPVPRKKSKGRPPKIKDTLSPEDRALLIEQMTQIYEQVLKVKDKSGRSRIDLFMELPSKRLYPDYYLLIKNPIACDIIKKRMRNNTYRKLEDYKVDFDLMWDNARTYNQEGSFVYVDANKLQKVFVSEYNKCLGISDDLLDSESESESESEPEAGHEDSSTNVNGKSVESASIASPEASLSHIEVKDTPQSSVIDPLPKNDAVPSKDVDDAYDPAFEAMAQ